MDIKLNPNQPGRLSSSSSPDKKKQEMGLEFEKLFTRQMVQEMTKGLFESDDNKPMIGAGSDLYREHIIDTLSQELAEQGKLGMADMITRYVDEK